MSTQQAFFTSKIAAEITTKNCPSDKSEFVNFKIQPFSENKLGFLGEHKQLFIFTKENDEDKILTFFVKARKLNCNDFEKTIFVHESKFYSEVLPKLLLSYKEDLWTPECYLVNENVIVLEDLRAKDYKVARQLTLEQLKAAIVSIARFQACCLLLQERLKVSLDVAFPEFTKVKVFAEDALGWKWVKPGEEAVEAVAKNLGLNETYVSQAHTLMLRAVKPDLDYPHRNVLCHQDLWSNNMMFMNENGETKCKIVDFQMMVYSSFATDLLMFLHLNITMIKRREVEKELIELYHTVMEKTLKNAGYNETKIMSLEEVLICIEERRIFGLVAAVQYLQYALLGTELAEEYSKDAETFAYHSFKSRKEFVLKAMQVDENYRTRIQESVTELIEYMECRELKIEGKKNLLHSIS